MTVEVAPPHSEVITDVSIIEANGAIAAQGLLALAESRRFQERFRQAGIGIDASDVGTRITFGTPVTVARSHVGQFDLAVNAVTPAHRDNADGPKRVVVGSAPAVR